MTPIQHVQQAMREATDMQAARLGESLDALTHAAEGPALLGLAESDDPVWDEHLVSVGDRAWSDLHALALAHPWLPDVLAFVGCCHIEGDAGVRWANGNLLDDTRAALAEYRGRA